MYDAKFNKLDNEQIQNVIFKELKASCEKYLSTTKLTNSVTDVFISYASEEKQKYVFPMYHKLKNIEEDNKKKYTIWIDENNLTMGEKLRQSIESVITYCKLAIVFFSDNYVKKGWTKYEL